MKYTCLIFCIVFGFSLNSIAQKNNCKELELRIAALEKDNSKLKNDMNELKQEVLNLYRFIRKNDKNVEAELYSYGEGPKIEFDETSHDFGKVKAGDIVSHVFNFKNKGNKPLLISNAKGSCGCAAANWPKESIAPGISGKIEVKFHSVGKSGNQHKSITITSNANPSDSRIYIKAFVE